MQRMQTLTLSLVCGFDLRIELIEMLEPGTEWGFTEDQIPDLDGTTVVVTGANSGLGFWFPAAPLCHCASPST